MKHQEQPRRGTCPRCQAAFEPGFPKQSFCSARCRIQANADRQRFRKTVGLMIQFGNDPILTEEP